jgi:hypothetical protein
VKRMVPPVSLLSWFFTMFINVFTTKGFVGV